MITLRLDKNGGINKGDIKAFEHDNLSEVYIIQLYKNGAIYDLTNKSIELTMVERKRKIGDMVSLPIYEATEGKVKLEVVSDITKQDGIYDFKLTVKDTTGLIETFPSFQVKIENDITDHITGEIVQDKNFTILTEGLKALADYNIYKTNALKVPEIEQDIIEINSQLDNIDYKNDSGLFIDIRNKIKSASIYLPINSIITEEQYISILDKCIDSNCNTITLCPIFWMQSKTSNVFTGYKTGLTKDIIVNYCIIAKNKGLKVALKPHVGGDGISSHGDIQPTDLTTWLNNYSIIYKDLLNSCKDYIDIVCVTNELNGQTNSNLNQWVQLINDIRNINGNFFIGTACHIEELSTNIFLSYLDFLGCNMYVPVEGDLSTNIEQQRKSLFILNNINVLLKKGDELCKPIIITEVGILPFEISLSNPEKWGFDEEPLIKEEVQVRYYNLALKEYLYGNNIVGTFIWNACDGFTFIDRKAQETVRMLYGGVANV